MMKFGGMEDRLNPVGPDGVDDTTLGGYPAVHGRAPGFEGSDGYAYTVAVELDEDGARGGWSAYLVFLRWANEGSAILGHLATEDLAHGSTPEDAKGALEALPLPDVKSILETEIARRQADPGVWDGEEEPD
jgi:hypothetical protein